MTARTHVARFGPPYFARRLAARFGSTPSALGLAARFVARRRSLVLAVLLGAGGLQASCGPKAPSTPPAAPAEQGLPRGEVQLPVDPEVRSGKLANGLTWFIETNGKPEQRAELRLIVDAGSVLEDDDQRGLAHWVEHMAFNGSTHFQGNELVKYLEGVGARFGPDLNAYTSFDETVYMLQVPTDDQEVFDKGFLVLEDWAHGLLFDPAEGEKERGVVLEEWRRRLGPGERAYDAAHAVRYQGSKYADRMPIGTEESLKSADLAALQRFYRDWYRPDLMAVAVVGDVDPDAVQAKIAAHFGGLTNPAKPRDRVIVPIGDREQTLASVFTDPELTDASISLEVLVPFAWDNTHEEYRDNLVEELALSLLNERLADLARAPDCPYIGARVGQGLRGRTRQAQVVGVSAREENLAAAFEAVLVEVRRAQLHGFTPAELERARRRSLSSIETTWQKRETTDSSTHVSEIVRHFLQGENMPGLEYELRMTREWVPTITDADVDAFARSFLSSDRNRAIIASLPAKPDVTPPTEADLVTLVGEVLARDVEPWKEATVPSTLVAKVPERGAVVERQDLADLGLSRWVLSNGVEVLVKPTDFRDDEILISAWSWGGTSVAEDDQYFSAQMAVPLRNASGLGAFDERQLQKFLAGHQTGVSTWIGDTSEGVSGWATTSELGLAMELTYLAFTEPRFDQEAFDVELRNREPRLRNRDLDPRSAYADLLAELRFDNHLRERPWTVDDLPKVNLAQASAFYRDRFADADGFTFAFVGDFEPQSLEPLVTQWLATLPSVPGDDTWVDRKIVERQGPARREVHKGLEPQASVRILMHGDEVFSRDASHDISAMASVLNVKLRERIREDLGGTYSVSASGYLTRVPREEYHVSVSFSCDPARVDELVDAAMGELKALRAAPVADTYLTAYLAKERRQREVELRENRSWAGWLAQYEQNGWDYQDILAYEELLAGDTPASIQASAERWIHPEKALVAILLPGEATARTE